MSQSTATVSSKHWSTANIPDQEGKVVVVTGANSGLGFETSRELTRKGAHVVMGCRTESKALAAIKEIHSEQPDASLEFIPLDLASLDSIQRFAEGFLKSHSKLHILCNNAGVMALPYTKTADGFEMQIGTNHFGHFALTGQLLPTILTTPGSRIVNVSSLAHKGGRIRFHDIHWEKRYSKWLSYCQSKLANLLFTYELQRKLEAVDADTICVACHPGYTSTNLQMAAPRMKGSRWGEIIWSLWNRMFAQRVSQGALTNLYASTAPEVNGGDYIGPRGFQELAGAPTKVRSSRRSHNKEDAQKLWELSVKATGITYEALS